MTVLELIELNQMIVDAEITVRKNGRLLDQLNIGPAEGVKPPHPIRVPISERYLDNFNILDRDHHKDAAYIPKSINSWDDGKDYWQVKPNRIPKKWLGLEVTSWECGEASTFGVGTRRRIENSRNVNFHGERIRIDVRANGEKLEIPEEKEELDGQMSIEDFLEA